jgi:hypothetical protein
MITKKAKIGLVGSTGFVGLNIADQYGHVHAYNSQNISDIRGSSFDKLFIAAPNGLKYLANRDPVSDLSSVRKLCSNLETIKTRHLVLISTVDVYPDFDCRNETEAPRPVLHHHYGLHRSLLEDWVSQKFNHTIVRLPMLFGNHQRKNLIYDLLTMNFDFIPSSKSKFQIFPLNWLKSVVECAVANKIRILNCVSEPITYEDLVNCTVTDENKYILLNPRGGQEDRLVNQNLHSNYAKHFPASVGDYLFTKESVLSELKVFVDQFKRNYYS